MPQIDITDILFDPFIAGESFNVLRRRETVNDYGESVVVQEKFENVIGSIQPIGDQSLVREEAYQSQAKSLRVITAFRLRGEAKTDSGKTYQPDLIYWHGNYFIVKSLEDYSQYGAGLTEADCTSIDHVDNPPWY